MATDQLLCGLYCLAFGLGVLGSPATLDDVQKRLGTVPPTAPGYSLGQMADVAQSYGFQTLLVETSVENLRRRPKPFAVIAHVDADMHFLCVIDVDPSGHATIFDPLTLSSGRDSVSRVDGPLLTGRWDGVALLISRAPLLAEEDLPWTTGMWLRGGLAVVAPAIGLAFIVGFVYLRVAKR